MSSLASIIDVNNLTMPSVIELTPPLLSSEYIEERLVCIRSHRERIFYTAEQRDGERFIYHNYGQGGAGWTFLFGCVAQSLEQFEARIALEPRLKGRPVCVIGAGCYGLLTSVMLARKGYEVQIVAREVEGVPSSKAAGFFFPRPRKSSTPEEAALFLSVGIESYKAYKEIAEGKHPFIREGCRLLPAYYGLNIDPGFAPYIEQGLMDPPQIVTIDFKNGKRYLAREYRTVWIEASVVLDELHKAARDLRIPIIKKEIVSWADCAEAIIFNCTGRGAQALTSDSRLIPVQGHLITLKNQPSTDHLRYMINAQVVMTNERGMKRDELVYYAPKGSGILGITFIRGQGSETANYHEFERLLERCRDYFGT